MSLAEMGACLGSFAVVWRLFRGAWPSVAFLVVLGVNLAVQGRPRPQVHLDR